MPAPDAPVPPAGRRLPPAWILVLVAGAVIATLRLVAPGLSTLLALAVGFIGVPVLLTASLRATAPNLRRAFAVFAVSLGLGSVSAALYPFDAAGPLTDLRALLDVLTYLTGIVGIVLFIRGTGRPDADAWLDAGAVGVGISVLLFEFVVAPGASPVTGRDRTFALLIAAVDAALLTCLARFVIRPLPSRSLTAIGIVLAAAAAIDTGYYTATNGLGMSRDAYEAMWFFAYCAWAAAAVHPDLPRLLDPRAEVPRSHWAEMRSSMGAIVIHSAGWVATMIALWHHFRFDRSGYDWIFIAVFAVQIALVATRSYRIVRRLAEDVDRRIDAEAALRESEERFRTLTDVAPVGIFVSDAAGRSVFQNAAWEDISGIHPSAALGEGYQDSIHPEDRGWAMAEWMRCVAAREAMRIEHRLLRPDGGVRWVSSQATPLRDDDGTVTGWVGTISDVTDLVVARTEAQEAASFASELIEQSPIGIHVYAPDGSTLSMNGAKRRIRARVLGEGTASTTSVADVRLDPLMARLGQAGAIGRVFDGQPVPAPDVVRVTPAANGTTAGEHGDGGADDAPGDLALRISWYPVVGTDGTLTAVISFTEDVTDATLALDRERRIEARLAEASQFEALTVLAGGIAHDFNNLLGAILGRAGLARSTMTPGSAVDRDLEAIEVAAVRAAGLARQLLSYAGRGRYVAERTPLEGLVRETLEVVAADLDPKAVLDVSFAPGLEPVDVDPMQVRQLILNLVANASEALQRRPGRISVRTGRHRLVADDPELIPQTPAAPGLYVVLEVEDDGHGMDEKTLGRVFDPFFTTKAVGRGLGLPAALGIATAHEAAIRIRSTPGKGTRVQVLFRPASDEAPPAASTGTDVAAADEPASWGAPAAAVHEAGAASASDLPGLVGPAVGRGTLLVVDDEQTVRAVARRVLERAGYGVVEASSGMEGITLFEHEPERWWGAVVDLTMPDVDGVVVVERMRRSRPGMPVVVCSGWAAQEVRDRMASVPDAAFLEKPYRPAELLAALGVTVSGGTTARS